MFSFSYYSVISNLSGISQKVAKYGNLYDYNEAPRAKIFRRDNVKAIDLQSFYQLMRLVSLMITVDPQNASIHHYRMFIVFTRGF